MEAKLRIEATAPDFFAIPLKQVAIEAMPETGRTYFIHKGRIVAVAKRGDRNAAD